MIFDFRSKMKNISVVTALLLAFVFGCQSSRNSQWLTLPKGSNGKIFGQSPSDDPFLAALQPAPPVSPQGFHSFAPVQENVAVPDVSAKESDNERIKAVATAPREGAPGYLQPLNHWDGPFADRIRRKNTEQEIIRQVGFEPVSAKMFSTEPEFDWERDEPKKGFDWSMLSPENSFAKVRSWMGMGPDENKANASMQKGKEILLTNPDLQDRKKNLEAAKHFSEAAKKYPDSVLEEDALHLAGECYFFSDEYYNAFTAYQKLIVKYQHSKHVDNAVRRVFGIGRYWELEAEESRSTFKFSDKSLPSFDTFSGAKKAYETIFTYDPLGPMSDRALMALATAYLKRGRYQGDDNYNQAAFYYQRLRDEHPSSPYIAKAYEFELHARTRAYMGAEHPSRTLDEAGKLAEQTLWSFRNDLDSEDKAEILAMKESILSAQAERLWSQGQFFDTKKRQYRSARVYYNKLIAEYPQTEYAEKARNRLVQIEGLRDVPPIFDLPINPFKVEE
jgi:outer membrane protein assembly factor BamD (BamD/ComL family)